MEERISRLSDEKDDKYDYAGNYAELIKNEMYNLYELESKVPITYRPEIHRMVVSLQAMLQDIQRKLDFIDGLDFNN